MSLIWKNVIKLFTKRYSQGSPHFLDYLIGPRYCGNGLTKNEGNNAFDFAKNNSSIFLVLIMKFVAKADRSFNDSLFEENIVCKMSLMRNNTWKAIKLQ